MSVFHRDWRDARVRLLVDQAFECDRGQEQLIRLCREFEADYLRLDARELVAAREAELETEQYGRVLEILRDTDPGREAAIA